MNILFKYVLLFSVLIYFGPSVAQQKFIDSLLTQLKTAKEDTSKAKLLKNLGISYGSGDNELAKKYLQESFRLATALNFQRGITEACLYMGSCEEVEENYDRAFSLYDLALKNATAQNDKRNIAGALTKIGLIHKIKGEYQKALACYKEALKIDQETGAKKYIARDYGNISVVYMNQGNHPKAIEYNFKVLKLFEELDNKWGIAATYGNLGAAYANHGDNEKAQQYFLRALEIQEFIGDKMGIARNYSNVGVIYANKKEYDKAQEYYFRSLKLSQEINVKDGVANCLGNIGLLYELRATALKNASPENKPDSLYSKALEYYLKALKMDEETGDARGKATKLGNIGSLYTAQKAYKQAEAYLLQAIDLSTQLGTLDLQKDHELFLYQLYNAKGDYKKAFEHYKLLALYDDSLFNDEKNKALARSEINYEFEKKEAAVKAKQEIKDAVTAAESKKQKFVLILVSCVLFLVFVFGLFVFRSLQITRKQKRVIEIKNKETEEQKATIQEKNKDILDSIHYARRIQQSLLPTEKYIERHLKS
ncbi:MAG: tetratricopeptide repeat protein [Bacteroidota bacterium]|nr:tetratricopeptide repeat protein [Bacteroidota bacterium]